MINFIPVNYKLNIKQYNDNNIGDNTLITYIEKLRSTVKGKKININNISADFASIKQKSLDLTFDSKLPIETLRKILANFNKDGHHKVKFNLTLIKDKTDILIFTYYITDDEENVYDEITNIKDKILKETNYKNQNGFKSINYKNNKIIFTIHENLYKHLIKSYNSKNFNSNIIENTKESCFEINFNNKLIKFKEYLSICGRCKNFHENNLQCTYVCLTCFKTENTDSHICDDRITFDSKFCYLCYIYINKKLEHLPNTKNCNNYNNNLERYIKKIRFNTLNDNITNKIPNKEDFPILQQKTSSEICLETPCTPLHDCENNLETISNKMSYNIIVKKSKEQFIEKEIKTSENIKEKEKSEPKNDENTENFYKLENIIEEEEEEEEYEGTNTNIKTEEYEDKTEETIKDELEDTSEILGKCIYSKIENIQQDEETIPEPESSEVETQNPEYQNNQFKPCFHTFDQQHWYPHCYYPYMHIHSTSSFISENNMIQFPFLANIKLDKNIISLEPHYKYFSIPLETGESQVFQFNTHTRKCNPVFKISK